MIRRRDLVSLLAGVFATPRGAFAQPAPEQPLVGILWPSSVEIEADFAAAIRKGMSDSGYVEGRNLALAMRYAGGDNRGVQRRGAP